MSTLMYKIVNNKAPHHLTNNLVFEKDINDRITRNSDGNNLYLPKPNLEHFRESLQYRGASVWNDLESNLKLAVNIKSFINEYKSYYWYQ